jgi:SAM-dependent methyltransferase
LSTAGHHNDDARVHFRLGDATDLPLDANTVDAAISGLVLNFVSDHEAMVREMARITRSDGIVAAYVWDYSGGMQMMRHFWDAAIDVSPDDAAFDQGNRFPICRPGPLTALFEKVGMVEVSTTAIDISTVFNNFDDYWLSFLGKQGSAPTYLASADDDTFVRIRETLRSRLEPEADGTIQLTARAWAVKGSVVK